MLADRKVAHQDRKYIKTSLLRLTEKIKWKSGYIYMNLEEKDTFSIKQ